MNFLLRTYFPFLLLFFYLCSCKTFDSKISPNEASKKTLLISVLSEGEELSGKGKGNFLSNREFDIDNLEWKTKEHSKAILENNLKEVFSEIVYLDASKLLNKSTSLDEIVVSSKKIFQKEFDYYLFLVPRDPVVKKYSSSDFLSNCTSVLCFPASLIYIAGYYSYKGMNSVIRVFVDEKKEYKIGKDEGRFRFILVGEPYKDFYRTRCFSGLDLVLAKKNEKKFVAYANMNYDAEVDIDVNYKYFSSFKNFSGEQTHHIKTSCSEAVSYAINRGLYNMSLAK